MSAYPEESYVEVVLEEGKVSYKNKDMLKEVSILPSERLIFRMGTSVNQLLILQSTAHGQRGSLFSEEIRWLK